MPVYKDATLKKKQWYFEIYLGKDEHGKRKKIKMRGFSSSKEAKAAMSAMETDINKGTYVKPTVHLYKDYLLEWIKINSDLNDSTRNLYRSYYKNHITPVLGSTRLNDLNAFQIQGFVIGLTEKGLAKGTIKRIFHVVHASLKDAVKLQLVTRNVATHILNKPKEPEKPEAEKNKVWDTNQINEFLQFIKGKTRYDIVFSIAIYCGMRQGEILGLTWSAVDLEGKTIRVNNRLSHDGKHFIPGAKSKSGIRTIAIGEELVKILRKQRSRINQERIHLGANYVNNDLVICTSKGTPVTPRNVMRVFYSFLNKIDVPKISFHDLRHTHATIMLLKAKIPIVLLSERLGHYKPSFTLDTYVHVLPNMQEKAAEAFDDALS